MSRSWLPVVRWCVLAAGLAWALGCAELSNRTRALTVIAKSTPVPKQLRERQVIVTLAADTPQHWVGITQALTTEYGLSKAGEFPLTSIKVQCVVFQVPANRSIGAIADRLDADPRVESVQVNQVFVGLQSIHTDPYASMEYGAEAIRADMVHRWSTGKGVKVAVLDTGVDTDHPDLRGRIVQTANFVDGGGGTFMRDRHGTAVAGVIGARADNGIGIYGIAPNSDLIAEKACWYASAEDSKALCSSWTLAKGIDFAINHGVQVLNMSLTGPPDSLLRRLLTAASDHGIVIVAAATGASIQKLGFPASLEFVIAVLASDTQGHLTVQAPEQDEDAHLVAAPGKEILTTVPTESYDFLSGSSLAAAHISGVVALLLEKQPHLSSKEILSPLARHGSATSSECRSLVVVYDRYS